jgi:hypothetical protein
LCIRKKSGYAAGCKYRGKSYNERFVNRNPNTGFKKGVLNPNYTRSKFIGLKMSNSKGEKFRSSLEVQFSELCIEHNIQYEYEKKIFLKDGRLKIVDFVIENLIHVEITGFAYLKWRQSFIEKMRVLRETIDNPILILTYKKNLKEDLHNTSIKTLSDTDVLLEDIDNSEGIVKKIKLFQNSFLLNQIIKK